MQGTTLYTFVWSCPVSLELITWGKLASFSQSLEEQSYSAVSSQYSTLLNTQLELETLQERAELGNTTVLDIINSPAVPLDKQNTFWNTEREMRQNTPNLYHGGLKSKNRQKGMHHFSWCRQRIVMISAKWEKQAWAQQNHMPINGIALCSRKVRLRTPSALGCDIFS